MAIGTQYHSTLTASRIPTQSTSAPQAERQQAAVSGDAADQIELSSEDDSSSDDSRLGGLLGGLQENFSEQQVSEGYGGRRFSAAGSRRAADTYRRHGSESLSLDDRGDVGRLISRSPQIDNQTGTNDDSNRCGGAAIFNAMLLDGNHAANAGAIRETLGDRITPEQRTALEHMEAGRLSPSEAALLQEGLYDHADGLNGRQDQGLNLSDMRRTVADLREHGAFPNTRELNFRRETVDSQSNSSHWTVSSRTTHGTHFADSYPQGNGYARVSGGEQAAFTPFDAEDRAMEDSLSFRPGSGGDEFQEIVAGNHGQWQQRDYTLSAARGSRDAAARDLPEDFGL
jgi:hypothetical protein